ncbi:hypothetical protein S7335_3694 [Synechococcus sp. PCC 7335]|uniref:FAD-dependent oxidoreductase n=1 Tax=Synechococcus sp. (strain ATCC 29403 / PCC 7335) TaxID=91464 RepID=UPI00017EC7B0|nr:FAD-dependent oxidoreductase [Synechococcus sp. PCC 7335]EDX85991.1 hypothetical protein S7335_3694 [Synechococcus sp. PCC 7335]
MAVEYDLVILGGTLAGRNAALQAASYGARVALVEPPGLFLLNQRCRFLLQALQQIANGQQTQAVSQWFGYETQDRPNWAWSAFLEWSAIATETQDSDLSVAAMSAKGVDVVLEMPVQLSKKSWVTTYSRQIKARAVLAAFGLSPDVFKPLLSATQLPQRVMVWGGELRSLLWAKVLGQLGVKVTLQTVEVLPDWNKQVQQLARSQLTQAGVTFLDPADTQVIDSQSDCTLRFGTEQPALILPKFAYRSSEYSPYLSVNRKLQAGTPRLFACGAAVQGKADTVITHQDLSVAIRNALFLPTRRLKLGQTIIAGGQFAMAGLTQTQAIHRYGTKVQVEEVTQANSTDLSRATPSPSYCQLVSVDRRLVGIHLVGDRAADYILPLAAFLGQSVAHLCHKIPNVPSTSPGHLLALAQATARQYQRSQWEVGHWKRDWSENWFNWRRSH